MARALAASLAIALAACAAKEPLTRVDLKQPPPGTYQAVVCIATYWDDAGVTPKGACRYTAEGANIGRRGEPYVKPGFVWYTAVWDLYGNINVGYQCAYRKPYAAQEPAVVYYNGYGEGNCNTTLVDMGEPFALLPKVTTRYWIGPSVAGEYVAGGTILYVP